MMIGIGTDGSIITNAVTDYVIIAANPTQTIKMRNKKCPQNIKALSTLYIF